jgi:hypothetical protein
MVRSDFFEHTKPIPTEHCGIFDFQSSTYLLSTQANVIYLFICLFYLFKFSIFFTTFDIRYIVKLHITMSI